MASFDEEKRVLVRGNPIYDEANQTASEAILPGHLVAVVAAGTVSKHATAAGAASASFANINQSDGGDISTAYTDGETVGIINCRKGDRVNAILEDGNTVAIGAFLESAGDGTLQPLTGSNPIAKATEAVTTSGATARIIVEVL